MRLEPIIADMRDCHTTAQWEAIELPIRGCFSRQGLMKTLGAKIDHLAPGELMLSMQPTDATSQHLGYIHAGAVTSLLDTACGFAAMSVLPPPSDILSVEFKVNLLAPAVGERIVARAEVLRTGQTLSLCRADAFVSTAGEAETRVAAMLATMIRRHTGTSPEE
jgi:uncharacterized protein (TIGR00369 family)